MTLNQFAAERRRAIFEVLQTGGVPEGDFDEKRLRELQAKGKPQMGSTHYRRDAVVFEFIYPEPGAASSVLEVAVPSPDRIIYLPVPDWVIEHIWQGEIEGSFHFQSDAEAMIAAFREAAIADDSRFGGEAPRRRG